MLSGQGFTNQTPKKNCFLNNVFECGSSNGNGEPGGVGFENYVELTKINLVGQAQLLIALFEQTGLCPIHLISCRTKAE